MTVWFLAYSMVFALSLFGCVRVFSAAFSVKSRVIINRHPLLYLIWFIVAIIVLTDVLLKLLGTLH